MRIFMSDDQTTRFFFISFFEPFFCCIFYQICDISFFTGPASVGKDKIRIEIMSLTDKNFEKIKTLWVIAQMIFPDPGGLVSCVLQSIDKLELTEIGRASCRERVESREDSGTVHG